ncbi:hypothetical protein Avbf_17976 [Armadillidium vulgare]|nr:hypothetical protein Avbf_17976 [Armadillidium vulgare]
MNSAFLKRETLNLCMSVLEQPHIQALKKEKFDLIIMSTFFNYCFLSFVHHFKVPFIYGWTTALYGVFHDMIGNIDVPAIIFLLLLNNDWRQLYLRKFLKHSNELYLEPKDAIQMCIERGMCPPDTPPFSEFHKNARIT